MSEKQSSTITPQQIARTAIGLAAIGVALPMGVALRRFLQVDELQILHLAWLRATGDVPGRDYAFPQFSLLIDILEAMWRVFGSTLAGIYVARSLQWTIAIAVALLTFAFARRLFGTAAAVPAVLLLCFFSDYAERCVEVRSDVWLVALALVAFHLIAAERRNVYFWAGVAAGFSVAFNFKSVFLFPFLAAAVAVETWRDGWASRVFIKRILSGIAGVLAAAAAYAAYLAIRGDIGLYVETISRNLTVTRNPVNRISPLSYFQLSAMRSPVFYILLAAGTAAAWWTPWRTGWFRFAPSFVFSLAYVAANPTFYPYNFTDVAPFWSIAAGVAIARIWTWREAVAIVLVGLQGVLCAARLLFLIDTPTLPSQIEMNRIVMSIVPEEERVYDASGLILFRRGPFEWRLHSLMSMRYIRGDFTLRDQLIRYPCRIVIPSYRFAMLSPPDNEFLYRNFPRFAGIGVAGWTVLPRDWQHGRALFRVLAGGDYRIAGSNASGVRFAERVNSGVVRFAPGVHLLVAEAPPARPVFVVWAAADLEKKLARAPKLVQLFYGFDY